MDYGRLYMNIENILEEKGVSKNRLCKDLDIARTNLNRYCRNDFQRIVLLVTFYSTDSPFYQSN